MPEALMDCGRVSHETYDILNPLLLELMLAGQEVLHLNHKKQHSLIIT